MSVKYLGEPVYYLSDSMLQSALWEIEDEIEKRRKQKETQENQEN